MNLYRQLASTTFIAIVLLAACSNQKAPAAKLIQDIDTQVNAAASDAAQYVPDQLKDVQTKLGELKADFDKKDYKKVISDAPPVMSAAQALGGAAVAKKDLIIKGLNEQWIELAGEVPNHSGLIQSRIDYLGKKEHKDLATGVDLDAAKASLGQATMLWAKAQASFADGNLLEAVTGAKNAKTNLDALAASMKLNFAQPAAVKDTSSGA
jgi:hypothetical protein